jgi:hypothetical protein
MVSSIVLCSSDLADVHASERGLDVESGFGREIQVWAAFRRLMALGSIDRRDLSLPSSSSGLWIVDRSRQPFGLTSDFGNSSWGD